MRSLSRNAIGAIFCALFLCQRALPVETLNLGDAEINGIAVMQAAGGSSFSGQLAWTPRVGLTDLIYGRGVLGATMLKRSLGGTFVVLNYEVRAGIPLFGALNFEAGGGLQTWVSNGGTGLVLTGALAYGTGWFDGTLDRIFFSYSRFFLSGNGTNEFRLGVGFVI